jgi:hypothetical protein
VRTAKRGRRCTLTVVRRRVSLRAAAGANRLSFRTTGLRPGRYVATIVATDTAGNRSAPVTVSLLIRRSR